MDKYILPRVVFAVYLYCKHLAEHKTRKCQMGFYVLSGICCFFALCCINLNIALWLNRFEYFFLVALIYSIIDIIPKF